MCRPVGLGGIGRERVVGSGHCHCGSRVRYQPASIAVDPSLGTVYAGWVIRFPTSPSSTQEQHADDLGERRRLPERHRNDRRRGGRSEHTRGFCLHRDSTQARPPQRQSSRPNSQSARCSHHRSGHGRQRQSHRGFQPPASDGGQNISSYVAIATDVTDPSRGGQTRADEKPDHHCRTHQRDTYTFTVTAANYAPGLPSPSSQAVVPVGVVSLSPTTVAVGLRSGHIHRKRLRYR